MQKAEEGISQKTETKAREIRILVRIDHVIITGMHLRISNRDEAGECTDVNLVYK